MKKKNREDEQLNQAIKITELEISNQALQEKLKLLRIQLESQAQFQYAARSLRSRSASLNRSRANLLSSRHFRSTNTLKSGPDNNQPTTAKSYDSIYHELNVLQEELENMRKQHRDCISEMKNQLAKKDNLSTTKLKNELDENIELINLKRFSKKQTAQIQSLQSDLDVAKAEIKQLQIDLSSLTTVKDNLQSELSKERSEVLKLNSDVSTFKENNKLLEEQLNDLQVEKATLKKHNEDLLNLSLQRGALEASDSRNVYLERIQELEADLRRETIAKTDLLAKIAEAEVQNMKFKSELGMSLTTITQLQSTTSILENELDKLKDKLKDVRTPSSELRSARKRKEFDVITPIEDKRDSFSKDSVSPDVRIRLCEAESELSQCKELLRVQYNLNNKHKQEIEELQMLFRQNEKSTSQQLDSFQNLLRTHQEKLSAKANLLRSNTLHSMLAELKNFLSSKKSPNLQDYCSVVSTLLDAYIFSYKLTEETAVQPTPPNKNGVDNRTPPVDKSEKNIQVDIIELASVLDNDLMSEMSEVDSSTLIEKENSVLFELRIERANFTFFSNHLMKSSQNNPKVFLTWNFLNDNEHQAYTPTVSVAEGVFNCMCQYEGPWSQFLSQYLRENGIRIEIHLVQGDITVRLAETVVNTSLAVSNPNKNEKFRSTFKNDNIQGDVTGSFILKCDPALCALLV